MSTATALADSRAHTGHVRRSLVLAGGGAKGAYAYGCLKAFREHGIDFDRVAGTSVGALNAAIWSTQAFELGDRLWCDLSFDTVLPVRIRHDRLPRWLYYLDGLARVCSRLMLATWAGVPHPLRRPCALINAALFAVPLVAFGIALAPVPSPVWMLQDARQWNMIVAIGGSFAAYTLYRGQVDGEDTGLLLSRILTYALVSIIVVSPVLAGLLVEAWPGVGGALGFPGPFAIWALLLFVVFVGVLVAGFVRASVRLATRLTRREVFANTRLRRHIADLLADHPLQIPTLVCVAERKNVFEGWVPLRAIPKVHRTPLAHTLARVSATAWIPRYVDIGARPRGESAELLLASASLPFGLLPSVRVGDLELVDGGVADNVPTFPFIDGVTDELFVVLLTDSAADSVQQWIDSLGEQWSATDLLSRRADVPLPPDQIEEFERGKWTHLDLQPRAAPRIPRIVLFQPSRPLGGFLSGTLNFKSAYARELMSRGQADADRVLSAYAAPSGPGR